MIRQKKRVKGFQREKHKGRLLLLSRGHGLFDKRRKVGPYLFRDFNTEQSLPQLNI
jgi:hypothetical protein